MQEDADMHGVFIQFNTPWVVLKRLPQSTQEAEEVIAYARKIGAEVYSELDKAGAASLFIQLPFGQKAPQVLTAHQVRMLVPREKRE